MAGEADEPLEAVLSVSEWSFSGPPDPPVVGIWAQVSRLN